MFADQVGHTKSGALSITFHFHYYLGFPMEEYCEWDTYDPKCNGDEVVLVEEATYGRMRTGTCIKDNRDIGCSYDVTNIAHWKCSGRRSCQITVPDRDLDATQPCGEMKNYLQISNTCIQGKDSNEVQIIPKNLFVQFNSIYLLIPLTEHT